MEEIEVNGLELESVFTLRSTKLFGKLPGEVLLAIAEQVERRQTAKEEVLFKQNDRGDGMYIIESGKVAFFRDNAVVNEFTAGSFFGELSLIDKEPRATTVIVQEEGVVLFLAKQTFEEITYSFPEVLWALTETVLGYLRARLSQAS